jgi:hypothetical protein
MAEVGQSQSANHKSKIENPISPDLPITQLSALRGSALGLPTFLPLLFLLLRQEFPDALMGVPVNQFDSSLRFTLRQTGITAHLHDSFYFVSQHRTNFRFLLIGKIELLA